VTGTPAITETAAPPVTPFAIANLPVILHQAQPAATPAPTRDALFVGLTACWDGRGFVRIDEYYEPGTHWTMVFSEMVGSDGIKAENRYWYDPNPLDWEASEWDEVYSISSGQLESRSQPGDPAFKWNYHRFLPYRYEFQDGRDVQIDGQIFRASGPLWGYGAFGQQIRYWRLTNLETFLAWDDDSGWQLFAHPGDVTLEYDPDTRLLLKSDVLRRYYLEGRLTSYTIQYINFLTDSNAYSAP
jgi:hypothetical protein